MTCSLMKNVRGKGYWKMNTDVLNDPNFCEGITNMLYTSLNEYNNLVSKTKLWEYIKLRIKEFTISFCKNRTQIRQDRASKLETKLAQLDDKLSTCTELKDLEDRKIVKQELDKIYREKARGYHIRSRAKWLEKGEKKHKLFFGA